MLFSGKETEVQNDVDDGVGGELVPVCRGLVTEKGVWSVRRTGTVGPEMDGVKWLCREGF